MTDDTPAWTIAARLALAAALVFTLTMALVPHPPALPIDRWGDKTQHMAAFVVLSTLASFAYPATSLFRIGERMSFLGALIEVLQSIPALHRDCDIFDWLTDTATIIGVLMVIGLIRAERAV